MQKLKPDPLKKMVTSTPSTLLIILVAASLLTIPVRADYAIIIAKGNVSVDIAGDFAQGVPLPSINDTSIFTNIPVFHSRLQGTNASILSTELSDAVKTKLSSASVTNANFKADSNGTLLHYELSFNVANVSRTSNGLERVDLSWRNFAINGDFGASGISINRILPNYLQPYIVTQTQSTGSPSGVQEVRNWYLDARATPASDIPERTIGLTLFNFSSLGQPLGEWSIQRDFSKSQVLLESSTGFNLTYVIRITEAESTSYFAFDAVNRLKVAIQAPLPLQVNDDGLVFDTGTAAWRPQLMLASVAAGLALLVGTYVFERRIKPSLRPRPRKAKR